MTEKFEFKAGDIVSFVGCRGIASEASPNRLSVDLYPIRVDLDNGRIEYFTLDGRHQHWHKEPSLFLVEKAKKEAQWYSVAAWRKTEPHPFIPVHLFTGEEAFLSMFSASKEDYHWIKLIPVCKTQGSSLVEE